VSNKIWLKLYQSLLLPRHLSFVHRTDCCRRLPFILRRPWQRGDRRHFGASFQQVPFIPESKGRPRQANKQDKRFWLRELQRPKRLHESNARDEW